MSKRTIFASSIFYIPSKQQVLEDQHRTGGKTGSLYLFSFVTPANIPKEHIMHTLHCLLQMHYPLPHEKQ